MNPPDLYDLRVDTKRIFRKGGLLASYLAAVFRLCAREAGSPAALSPHRGKTDRIEAYMSGRAAPAPGYYLFFEILCLVELHAPRAWAAPGIGDFLRTYAQGLRVTGLTHAPAVWAEIEQYAKNKEVSQRERAREAERHRRLASSQTTGLSKPEALYLGQVFELFIDAAGCNVRTAQQWLGLREIDKIVAGERTPSPKVLIAFRTLTLFTRASEKLWATDGIGDFMTAFVAGRDVQPYMKNEKVVALLAQARKGKPRGKTPTP